jgi:hypothetical protein
LIVLNGSPASGKSTLAQRYVDDHPLTLNLDIDRIRGMIGCWRDDSQQGGLLARAIALSAAAVHLDGGHDVVVPQFVAQVRFAHRVATGRSRRPERSAAATTATPSTSSAASTSSRIQPSPGASPAIAPVRARPCPAVPAPGQERQDDPWRAQVAHHAAGL